MQSYLSTLPSLDPVDGEDAGQVDGLLHRRCLLRRPPPRPQLVVLDLVLRLLGGGAGEQQQEEDQAGSGGGHGRHGVDRDQRASSGEGETEVAAPISDDL